MRLGTLSSGIVAAVAVFAVPASAGVGIPVAFGDTISFPGIYQLDGNQSGSGDGIRIEADYVFLDLGGYRLTGDGGGSGIFAQDRQGVTIYNGRITNFEEGINLKDSTRCLIKQVRADHCVQACFDLDRCTYTTLLRCEADNCEDDGFELESSTWCLLLYLRSHHNGDDGIDLNTSEGQGRGSDNNLILHCESYENVEDGIDIDCSSNNRLISNRCYRNGDEGIDLECDLISTTGGGFVIGSDDNLVKFNVCTGNDIGIEVQFESDGNHFVGNTALLNWSYDLFDDNSDCLNNWHANIYFSAGGNGSHCIQ